MKILTNYTSPTVLTNALLMVIIFSRLQFKGTIISKLSPLVFGIYLFQLNQIIWMNYLANAFSFVAQANIFMGVVYAFVFAALIFVSGLIVEYVRSKIAKIIKIPELSKKVVNGVYWMLEKASLILR